MWVEIVIGALLLNHENNDPEWRFHAGYLVELLEGGAPMPSRYALGGLSRVAGATLLTREQIIEWARSQERSLN